jgi:hypothetical protein
VVQYKERREKERICKRAYLSKMRNLTRLNCKRAYRGSDFKIQVEWK